MPAACDPRRALIDPASESSRAIKVSTCANCQSDATWLAAFAYVHTPAPVKLSRGANDIRPSSGTAGCRMGLNNG